MCVTVHIVFPGSARMRILMSESEFKPLSEAEFQRLTNAQKMEYMNRLNLDLEARIAEARRQINRQKKPAP